MKCISILAGAMIVALQAAAANDASFTFDFHDDGTCTLTKALCDGDVTVPQTVTRNNREYTLTAIGAEAFADSRVVSLSLPSSLTEIKDDAFRRCNALEKVSVPDIATWLGITFHNEYASPLNGYRQLYVGDKPYTALTIPPGVTELHPYAFYDCVTLETADLSGLTAIPSHAFDGCENLVSVSLDEGLTAIGNWAFSICTGLREINIPESVTTIGEGTFYGCSALSAIKLPRKLTSIPALSFAGCISLKTLDFLPPTLRSVGDYAFYFCTGLETAFFPQATDYFGAYLFQDCESLREASFPHPGSTLGEFIFANCYQLTSVQLPQNIITLPEGLFFECRSLKEINLPETLEEISQYAFGDCHALPFLALPHGMKRIGDRALYGCHALTRIDFPESMESIGAESFYQCSGLQQIHVRSVEPFDISFFSFDWRADREATVYVPASSVELYRDDKFGWGNFDNIVGLTEYNPDTWLDIRWGDVTVGRPVDYGTELRLCVKLPDGTLPQTASFNDTPLPIDSEGYVTTPPITGKSVLTIK